MRMRDLDAILEAVPEAGDDLPSRARGLLAACLGVADCGRGQLWLWRRAPDAARRLERIASEGEDWEENILGRSAGLAAFEGALRTTRHGDGLHVAYIPLGSQGFLALAAAKPVDAPVLAELQRRAARIGDWIAGGLSREEIDRANRWLMSQSARERSAAASLAGVRSVEDLGRVIESFSEQLFPIEYSGIYFLEPHTGALRLVYAKGLNELERENAERTAPQRHPGQVIRTGVPVEIDDTAVQSDPSEPPGHGRPVRSRIYLPVHVEGRTVGSIGFASSQPSAFGKQHHEALAFLCDLAGVTYARIRDHEELVRRGRMLEATAIANERLLKAIEWRAAATAALALVGDALGVRTLALVEVQRAAGDEPLDFIWQPVFGAPWPHRERVARLTGPELELMRGGLPLELALEPGRRSTVLKPVLVGDQVWGVLACEVDASALDRVGTAERAALRGLASGFASAIERERIDRELRERQQLDAVSRLAGGIAHDFNNLLWPILLYSDMLERQPGLEPRARQMLQDIRKSAARASELVQQVFAVARSRDRVLQVVDVPQLAVDVSATARHGAPSGLRIRCEIDADAGHVLGDEDAIRELLRTLVALALEEAGDAGAGEIAFVVERVERDRGAWIRIELSHGGRSLVGSALRDGALVRLVAELGGELMRGPGLSATALEVFLPIALREQAPGGGGPDDEPSIESLEAAAAATAASDRVLLVDDDAAVLEVARQIVESLGYEVVGCNKPEAAIEFLKDPSRKVSLLLTDLAMPGMDGLTLAREAKRLRPGLPIVCCTGFGDARAERNAKEIGVFAFIRKPIDFDHYAKTIRAAIDGSR